MKVSTEIDNNFGYEKITQLVDNIPLNSLYYRRNETVHFLFFDGQFYSARFIGGGNRSSLKKPRLNFYFIKIVRMFDAFI